MNLEYVIETAKIAERGKLDMLFISDGNGVAQMDTPELFEANCLTSKPAVFEPVTLLSALAMHTKRIGLLATATTTYEEPYTLARKFASLDHLSKGRACWNIVTTSNELDSHNFGKDEHLARYDRYERAREFVQVCKGLWDSWAEDAFLQDKATGRYLDISKVRLLNHKGKHFSVRGPLNVARCPQGYPILFSAGQSDPGRELAASMADCMFAATPTKQQAIKLLNDVKDRMAKYGRAPHELRVLPGAVVYVGRTAAEADEKFEELQSSHHADGRGEKSLALRVDGSVQVSDRRSVPRTDRKQRWHQPPLRDRGAGEARKSHDPADLSADASVIRAHRHER